ncbi:response regulator [Roseomonas chloroacetimidivorans]|jgi:CheY-like chemotaxis protein|uniref:response regulator n=1 Tax=Roseomonas chloroacetimidivorans TaxID=1766656 RepID=UPI003C7249AE
MTETTPPKDLSGQRVLVVEDEFFVADDLATALSDLGAAVIGPVATAEGALALLSRTERIDLAVLDVNLRGDAAFPVADALNNRGVPFILATGYTQSALPARFMDVPHWEKPFDPRALVRALSALSQRA